MTLDLQTRQLLALLHRGGVYAYWWTLEGQHTTWWRVGAPAALPSADKNIYVGVHPTTRIPDTNVRGELKPSRSLRAQLGIIAALGCFYTELDAKDFDGDKDKARAAVDALDPRPSVLIDSGGGYHLYWLLDEPWILVTDEDREEAKRYQAAWVAYVGGDPAVKDLARVLRVPGTLNYKYDPPRTVTYIYADFDRRFARAALQAHCAHLLTDVRLPYAEGAGGRTEPANREQRYAQAALDREIAAVLRAPSGMKHDQIRNTAIKLGSMVARGWLDQQEVIAEITRAADAHRADTKDTARTVLDGLAYGEARPHADLPRQHDAMPGSGAVVTRGSQTDVIDSLPILLRATQLHQIPPAIPLIPDILYVNKLHQFFGAPGGGKSFIMLDIACTVAQSYRVVYVAAEAIEDYEERINAWTAHHGRTVDNLYFWREPLHLANMESVQSFITAIHSLGPALIVFDPMADCMTGLDENTPLGMGTALFALNTIRRETRAAIAAVHHTGWNDERERGYSSFRGASRIVVKIEMRDDGLIRFSCVKKNQGSKFTARMFRLVAGGTMGGVLPLPAHQVMVGRTRPTDRMLRVLEALTTEPLRKGATHTQLMQDTGFTAGTLNRVMTSLDENGFVTSWEKGRATYYKLTDAGQDALDMAADEGDQAGGRTLEDSGRIGNAVNWKVLSSTDTGLQEAILPLSSIPSSNSAQIPPLLSPKGEKGDAGEGFGRFPAASNIGFREPLGYQEAPQAVATNGHVIVAPDVVSPPEYQRRADWDYLRRMLDSQNMAGFRTHCALTGTNPDDALAHLETERGDSSRDDDDELF